MRKRVPPSEQTRQAIRELLDTGVSEGNPLSELVRLAVRQIVEEALESKVRDLPGRGYYEHQDDAVGYRNGYRPGRLQAGEVKVRYASPQVRGRDSTELGELRQTFRGRSEALEQLAVEMDARGCSTRDIEAVFRDDEGRSLLSRTAVSELTESLWQEYEAFATRDLSELRPLYLFVDGIAERLRAGAKREAILCAWAITWEGAKVLVHLAPGTKESTECCRDFFQDLRRRGLTAPVLVVTDGAAGLIRAVEECFPQSLRQRCLAHRLRNLMGKLTAGEVIAEFKQAAKAACQAPSPALARVLRDDLVARYGKLYPTAVRCFEEDFEACIAHLHCPPVHRRVIRTTNLLERLFVEVRCRVRAARTVFGERPVLKLMLSAVLRTSDTWRGIRVSEFEAGQLWRLNEQLEDEHWKDHQLYLEGSTQEQIYSTKRTCPFVLAWKQTGFISGDF